MKLIADSGATKAEWVVIQDDHQPEVYETPGFNPYFTSTEYIEEIIEKDLVPFVDNRAISEIYFYGAGCSTISKCTIVENALIKEFPNAHVEIYHDLLGAARALFGDREGIACILGTGSNSCYYDGEDVVENISSLGYLFGDEGSGAYAGKIFLRDFLKGYTPKSISKAFIDRYGLNLENILDSVYNQPQPNRFLASFAEFLGNHLRSPYIRDVMEKNFDDFFVEQVTRYGNYKEVPVGVVGSIGYHFKEQFRKVAKKYDIQISRIVKTPVGGLVEFHR
jgi:N-acetylglucosamine kinase-like BadF-type ATPase